MADTTYHTERLDHSGIVVGICDEIQLAEHKLRCALKERNESIPNQVGKPTRRPTMRRIFQMFEGIDVLVIHRPDGVERHITNLNDLRKRILHLLGPHVEKCYLGPG